MLSLCCLMWLSQSYVTPPPSSFPWAFLPRLYVRWVPAALLENERLHQVVVHTALSGFEVGLECPRVESGESEQARADNFDYIGEMMRLANR